MEKYLKITAWIVASLLFQSVVYLYFDQILFAPSASYQVSAVKDTFAMTSGKTYYSRDRRYTAIVKNNAVEFYETNSKKLLRTVDLQGDQVSYFKWLEDRDLALMAVYSDVGANSAKASLTPLNPVDQRQELTAALDNLPRGSKITDVAYSTATNVVYMQVQLGNDPEAFRVYRTDANHNLTRVYLQSSRINRIAVLYDQDYLLYDNLTDGTIIARHTDGSWSIISPVVGKYRLIGVDAANNIYIARVNTSGMAEAVRRGFIKIGFADEKKLPTPMDFRQLTVSEAAKITRGY